MLLSINNKLNITLCGMMGSGKSTIGYHLSKKMNFQFFDIDKIIEKEEGEQIKDIFSLKGESYFRRIEEKITLNSLKNSKSILSLGGELSLIKVLILKSVLLFQNQESKLLFQLK